MLKSMPLFPSSQAPHPFFGPSPEVTCKELAAPYDLQGTGNSHLVRG